jgi:hypothetical protein
VLLLLLLSSSSSLRQRTPNSSPAHLMSLINKPYPDIAGVALVTAAGAGAKTTLKKFLASKAKTVVICFVSAGAESAAAISRMEEGAFQKATAGKASFVIISVDSIKSASGVHKECAITGCSHLQGEGKAFNVLRTPHHVVLKDGKVVMSTDEVVAPYMSYVS